MGIANSSSGSVSSMDAAIVSRMEEARPTGMSTKALERFGLGLGRLLGVSWGRRLSPASFGLPASGMGAGKGLTGRPAPSPRRSAREGTLRFWSKAWSSGKGVVGRVLTEKGGGAG